MNLGESGLLSKVVRPPLFKKKYILNASLTFTWDLLSNNIKHLKSATKHHSLHIDLNIFKCMQVFENTEHFISIIKNGTMLNNYMKPCLERDQIWYKTPSHLETRINMKRNASCGTRIKTDFKALFWPVVIHPVLHREHRNLSLNIHWWVKKTYLKTFLARFINKITQKKKTLL